MLTSCTPINRRRQPKEIAYLKQFTARDVISRWDVTQAPYPRHRPNRRSVPRYLAAPHALSHPRCASRWRSEFAAEFELACQLRGLHLFVLPPRSPKLNGAVERVNRTHTDEFYQVTPCSLEMKKLNHELRHWKKIYNTVRPHQALRYLTPQQFLRQVSSQRRE
jgi:putative transposase